MHRIHDVLKQLSHAAETAQAHHEAFFADQCATVTLISGLAEGADRMAAQAAIEQDLELNVIVPFAIDSYEQDFEDQASRL
jgi:predicted Rossmann fold nucleotide-binding protein DprA/Smf involved in DNA uptake